MEVGLSLARLSADVRGTVRIASPHAVEGTISLDRAAIETLSAAAEGKQREGLGGVVSARFEITGPLKTPEQLRVSGSVNSLDLLVGNARFTLASPAEIEWTEGAIALPGALLLGEGSRLSLSGRIFPGDPVRFDARLQGEADLRTFQPLVRDASLRGAARLDVKATGTPTSPVISGTVTVSEGRLRRFDAPVVIENLSLNVEMSPGVIDIREISAAVGGGTVRGSGRVTIDGLKPLAVEAIVRASAVTISAPRGFRAAYSGTVRLSGAAERPVATGDLEIVRGVYTKDFRLESFSLGARTREFAPEPADSQSPGGGLELDIRLHADDNLWLKNDFGEVENRAQLVLSGTLARPRITGRIVALEGGEIHFRRVDYRLREAALEMAEPDS
ncbi:MAG: translocation/assembly module TamB domain-containing protein, partial [Vicinamibacteria bacterium]